MSRDWKCLALAVGVCLSALSLPLCALLWLVTLATAAPQPQPCLDLSAQAHALTVTDSDQLDITDNFTVCVWVHIDDYTRTQDYLLSKLNAAGNNNPYAIIYGYVGYRFEFYAAGYSGSNPRTGTQMDPGGNGWCLVTYSYDGSTWAGYLNDVQQFSTSRTFSLATDTGNLIVGNFTAGAAQWFSGDYQRLLIYNRGLSQTEVERLYREIATYRFRPTDPAIVLDLYLRGTIGSTITEAYDRAGNTVSVNGTPKYAPPPNIYVR